MLRRAADPAFPSPLAYLALTYLTGYNNKWSDDYEDPVAINRMLDLAGRALELDPDFATAYAAQAIAYTYLGGHDEAASAAARAVEANPNDPDVLGRAAQVPSFSGRHEDAIAMLARAIELDPFGPAQWFNFLSRAHFFLGRYDAAIAAARTCLDRARLQHCRETLAAALALPESWALRRPNGGSSPRRILPSRPKSWSPACVRPFAASRIWTAWCRDWTRRRPVGTARRLNLLPKADRRVGWACRGRIGPILHSLTRLTAANGSRS